ncbi:MAG: transporter substrate-binding domain-containing protein [Anaerolineales bacterium]|jgi:polar amino acid transport system substrate-binding protein
MMNDNPFTGEGRVGIRLDKEEYFLAPSGNITVTITMRNQGLEDDRFALGVGGVPAAWVSTSQPAVDLAPGEEKEAKLVIQAPALGENETGERSLVIRVASKGQPDQYAQVAAKLMIKTESVLSRVAVEMESTQFTVAPGSGTTFGIKVTNNGLAAETLRLKIEGIPTGWISTPSPVTELDPGEEKEIRVTVSPPRASESQAGVKSITVKLVSEQNPEQAVIQECVLTIGSYTKFTSELQPDPPIDAQQNAQINITNDGNVDQTFQIDWHSEEDLLAFELWQQEGEEVVFNEVETHTLAVEPGKQETTHFRAGLRKRPFIGNAKLYPFQVKVQSGDEVVTHDNQIKARGLIPIWVIPLILVLCVVLACLGVFGYNWLRDRAVPVTEDDSWTRVQEAGVLRVATSADYPPFSYFNDDYVIDGFDPALIRDVGIVLGVETEISDFAFEGLASVLQVGQADVAIAAISVTPERQAEFDFSNIYYVGLDGILANDDSDIENISNPGQMAGMRVGVQRLTVYAKWAQEVLVDGGIIAQDQLFEYAKPEHAVDDLVHNRVDLVIMDLQPATAALSEGGLKLVGQGLNQQRLAIALPKGANALRAKINEALLYMQNQGRVNQLVQYYLGLNPADIIPPPTPQPTPEFTETPLPTATEDPNTPTPTPCIDAMEFVQDLTYDDEDLTNFPDVDPGQAFQKGWRLKNSGSCTWNSSYFIKYTHGSSPAAQMGGQPTSIKDTVSPGQTYDMYVDLVAPQDPGEYVGYWQMFNSVNKAFGQTVWVAVEVRNLNPATVTATVTPQASATPPPQPTATNVPPQPTNTDVPPQPTDTVPPQPTDTDVPVEPTATEEPGEDLRDTTWILEGYLADINDDQLTDPITDVDLELVFNEGGSLNGFSGCNTFNGDYVTDGTELTLENIIATRLSCNQPAGIMQQETTFLALLEDVEEYRFNQDGKLEFVREVVENNQTVQKVILLFYDQSVGP